MNVYILLFKIWTLNLNMAHEWSQISHAFTKNMYVCHEEKPINV